MEPTLLRALGVVALLAVVALVGAWWRRRDGRVTATRDDAARLTPAQLTAVGLDLDGALAGAVLLGSPTCSPCVTVRRILAEVATARDGFRWVSVDAADHLDLAREHRVLRVPTLFVVDGEGRILARTSGVPGERDLLAVLDRGTPVGHLAA